MTYIIVSVIIVSGISLTTLNVLIIPIVERKKREAKREMENNNNNPSQEPDNNNNNNTVQSQQQNGNSQSVQPVAETEHEKTLSEFLKECGVESEGQLGEIIKKNKEYEESQKTELEKSNDNVSELTKKLAEERQARVISDAKLLAMTEGADKNLIDDLVIVVMARVTKDKGVSEVIKEIKESPSGKIYFPPVDEGTTEKEKRRNITGGSSSPAGKNNGGDKGKESAPIASRLFKDASKTAGKSSYFKN